MAVILTVSSIPASYTVGSAQWPGTSNATVNTLNGATWRFTFAPTAASTTYTGGNYHSLFAQTHGGIWLVDTHLQMFTTPGDALVFDQALTWSAGQTITVTVNAATKQLTIAGATTGNGTFSWTTSGPYFDGTATLYAGNEAGTFSFTGTLSSIDDTAPAGASGTAAVAGITSSGTMRPGTLASGSAAVAGVTSTGGATGPGTASGTASVAGTASTGSALTPAVASGSASVGGITASGTVGGSLWGQIGAMSAGERADQTGAATGTFSTQFANRSASTAVTVNQQLYFNGRRWIVNTAGTTGSGAGPSPATGLISDGTASLVALNSSNSALTMTTQPSGSMMVALLMRENWSSDPSAPTDNKGNTYALQGSAHFITAFPSAATAVYVASNATGGAGHVVSATWPTKSVTGAECSLLVLEVPTGRSTSFVQGVAFAEVGAATSVTSPSVTTTGPAMLIAFWGGTGGLVSIGTQHPGVPSAPFAQSLDADTAVCIHNNGYIQGKSAYSFQTAPGTFTATWTGTTGPSGSGEGAHLYLIAIQEAPGTLASGSGSVGGVTSAGATTSTATVVASGSASVAGVSSAGVATLAVSGAAAAGGVSASGLAGPGATGTASKGSVTSTGSAGVAAVGAGASGGVSAAGAAGPAATGASAIGGVAGSGVAAVAAAGAATVAGVASSGMTSLAALGSAAVAGVSATGLVGSSAIAGGISAVAGATGAGTATSTASAVAFGACTVAGVMSSGATTSTTASAASGAALVGGISSAGLTLSDGPAMVGGVSSAGTAASIAGDPILAYQDAIWAWVVATSGLAADHVIWVPDGTAGPSPAGTYIALRLNGIDRVSRDWTTSVSNGDGTATVSITGTRHPELEITCYVGATDGAGAAKWILDRVLTLRVRPDQAKALRVAGIGMGVPGSIKVIPGSRSGMYDPFARVSIPLVLRVAMTYTADIIGSVTPTIALA